MAVLGWSYRLSFDTTVLPCGTEVDCKEVTNWVPLEDILERAVARAKVASEVTNN